MVTTATRVRVPRSRHERAILTAIGYGATVDDLLGSSQWTLNDVATTLRRHGLAATEDGRLVRRHTVTDLLRMAQESRSPYVRHQAAQAAEKLRAVTSALNDTTPSTAAARARQRDALRVWQDWLIGAQAEARIAQRRLRHRPLTDA